MLHGGVEYQLHLFWTSALDGGELASSRLCRVIHGESVRVRRYVGGWVGSRAGSMSLPGNEQLFLGDTARSLVTTL